MRTANPALNDNIFTSSPRVSGEISDSMTINGTVNKTAILLCGVLLTAAYSWNASLSAASYGQPAQFSASPLMMIGGIGGFIFALITIFKKTWAPVTAPAYALLEGLFLGGISAGFETLYPGIVTQAVFATFGTLFALLLAYKSGLIKVTENFRLGVVAATGGIALVYLIGFVMSFFGKSIPMIHESGLVGIGFSLFVVAIASMNLVLDFDFIENGEQRRAPKYMEWYAAFGLLVTLVWLYLEMLRLLSKLKNR